MKAQTSVKTTPRYLFACPDCGQHQHEYAHLINGPIKFGPWYCNKCGCGVLGEVKSDGSVDIERHHQRLANTLVLLRLNVHGTESKPIHIVVKHFCFYEDGQTPVIDQSRDEFYFNEHTCPSNYLKLPIKEGDNTDPHGVFVHQETILMPDGYDGHIAVSSIDGDYEHIGAWLSLFKTL